MPGSTPTAAGRATTQGCAAGGRAGSRRRTARREECLAWIEGALPAYISLAQHEANLARLKANRAHGDVPGAVRFGPALLAGLPRCGRCGRRMTWATTSTPDGPGSATTAPGPARS